jgi:hypothetical protein
VFECINQLLINFRIIYCRCCIYYVYPQTSSMYNLVVMNLLYMRPE